MSELPRILVVMALEIESAGVFAAADVPVLYCGVGKVNAAIALTRSLARYVHAAQALPLVVNFGSAGSRCHAAGTLLACREFLQRDMDVSGLGFALGVTPYEATPPRLMFDSVFAHLPAAVCGSGDSFATVESAVPCDVVDMEAYALAKVCWVEQTSFACVKYITDGADAAAAADWQSGAHRAAEQFLHLYHHLNRSNIQ